MEQPDIFDLGLPADMQMWQAAPLGRRKFLKMGAAALALSGIVRSDIRTSNVFSDGVSSQMVTVTGDVTNGYTAQLVVGVAA